MKIKVPTVENVIQTNKFVCNEKGQASQLLDRGKIESALSTAFYPGLSHLKMAASQDLQERFAFI